MLLLPTLTFRCFGAGVALLLLTLITSKIISSKLKTRKYKAEAARRGCEPAPTLHGNNLLGTSRLKDSIKATKEDRGPQYVVSAMNELGENVHTLRLRVLDYELLVTRDPENVKAMFSTQCTDYDISTTRSSAFMPLLGEGIFTSRGAQWKHSRVLVRPQFSREEISNLDLVDRHVRIMQQVLPVGDDKWNSTVDLQPLFFNFTIDTATEFLYGESVHSQAAMAGLDQKTGGIDGAKFSYHFGAAKHLVDKRGALGKLYWLMPMKEMKAHCAEIHKVIDGMIATRLAAKKDPLNMEEKGSRKFVLLDELVKETQDLKELRNETLHALMAGRDPTGALLGWVFYFLARHPGVFSKLRGIILSQFGTAANPNPDIDFNALRSCEYLQRVMHEAIRIVAIIPMNERIALRDTTLPRGGGQDGSKPIFVRKGIQILNPLYAIQHRRDLWGDDADGFRPERWEEEDGMGMGSFWWWSEEVSWS